MHGLLGAAADWRFNLPALAREYDCLPLQLPPAPNALPGLRRWLEAEVNWRGLRDFSLLGSSWGGAAALEFAAHSPLAPHLRALALAAPAHPYCCLSVRQRWLLRPPFTQLAAGFAARAPRRRQAAMLARMFGDPALIPADAAARYRDLLRRPGLGRSLAAYVRDWPRHFAALRAALPGVACPVLLLWGDRDRAVPASSAPALLAALPRAQLRLLPGAGHLPFQEQPELFNRLLLAFLRGAYAGG